MNDLDPLDIDQALALRCLYSGRERSRNRLHESAWSACSWFRANVGSPLIGGIMRTRRLVHRGCGASFSFLSRAVSAHAQYTGNIQGIVADPSGAAIPNATLERGQPDDAGLGDDDVRRRRRTIGS